jgi:uncharacterized protein GlcG (DUF336 family)
MRRYWILSLSALFIAISFSALAYAQGFVTERQISLSQAQAAAHAAVEQCRVDGFRVSAAVVDRAGNLKALLRDDETGPLTLDSARRKAFTAASFRTSTTELAARVATDPGAANLEDISEDVLILGGGLPIMAGDEVVGGIGVGGAPGGDKDEACAQAGLQSIMGMGQVQ